MTDPKRRVSAIVAAGLIASGGLFAGAAQATEGYFQHGYGVRQQSLGGAGVADSRDAMSLAVNPAGLTHVGNQFNGAIQIFSPRREFDVQGGPGFLPAGKTKSNRNWFFVPTLGYSYQWDENNALGIALFGNGGLNTSYSSRANPACAGFVPPGTPPPVGIFCGGKTGVDLSQAFLALGYAHRFDRLSVGVSPVLVMQIFEAKGLSAFGIDFDGPGPNPPPSSNPAKLTNNGKSYSFGVGARVGFDYAVTDNFRVGATYASKVYMSKFKKYKGLFENGGDFDIPANFSAGVAFDVMPELTLLADYKRIWYSNIDAIGNSSATPSQFGLKGGPGFGWKDVDIFKLGVEWRANDTWTLRAGYAHNTGAIRKRDVTLNTLATAVVKDHITGGFSYRLTPNSSLDLALLYVPEDSIKGIEVTPQGANPGRTIEIKMYQFSGTLGWTYNF